ncbi:kinesin motor domain-containing protein [Ditylenchus destructor]|nr:kinesin motor domain-containing protein [Ditylenchus destructor]
MTNPAKADGQESGYIRVSARIRPMIEDVSDSRMQIVFPDELGGKISLRINSDEKCYSFDNVFSGISSQESIFINVGKRIIDGCIAGYNGTIFAYGQTGSGKTFTMFGPQSESGEFKKAQHGLIPRSMEYLFDVLNAKQEENGEVFKFSINCSFVQLYNEGLYDLLDNTDRRLKIRSAAEAEIEGATTEPINSSQEVMNLLKVGYKNRRKAETLMNRESSRSHAIFILHLITEMITDGVINRRYSRLNLVDLAGCERQQDSQSTGEQLKEAGHINKSLSILTRVIRTLSRNPTQYPGYRDSQLTLLLKDSLGGNAKTAVIINLHPDITHADTTTSSLYFSETVKRVKNKATVNENVAGENIESLKKEILRLHDVVRNSKEELASKDEIIRGLLEQLAKAPAAYLLSPKKEGVDQMVQEEVKENIYSGEKLHPNTGERISQVAELEATIENYKNLLAKKDDEISQYEASVTYKSHRVDCLRNVVDSTQAQLNQMEEENESLKKTAQFQKILFEKDKLEKEMTIRKECRTEIEQLKEKIQELQKERDIAREELGEVAGHQNTKQKIKYVNSLREKIASLEKENADIKSLRRSTRVINKRISKSSERN